MRAAVQDKLAHITSKAINGGAQGTCNLFATSHVGHCKRSVLHIVRPA